MPQGGTLSTSLSAIFLCAYLMGVGYGVIVGISTCILQFVLGMANYWGFWSILLDYLLPLSICGLAPLIKSVRITKQFELHLGLIFVTLLKFIPHYLSGAILFASHAGDMNPYLYSFIYNAPYVAISGIVCLFLCGFLYPRLEKSF